jgi:UDP-N-acetylglucosamine 2-epimerase (non-hydrolysing)
MRLLTICGTRPEAIKLAPVVYELRKRPAFDVRICVTGQHREMLDQALRLFDIKADHDLDLMRADQSLSTITAHILTSLEGVFRGDLPDLVIVQGDTTTAFAAALAACYVRVSVAHVEAGLRTHDKQNPYPEEINRVLTDALSTWCFAPTSRAHDNLLREGIAPDRIFVTGNTIIDAVQRIRDQQLSAAEQRRLQTHFAQRHGVTFEKKNRLLLVTSHRRESFGSDLESICTGLKQIAERNPDVQIVYPVHLNPNVQRPVHRILGALPRVHLIQPIDYDALIWLLSRCYFVLTDSGGIQEEAPAFGKPVLVLRRTTERPEGVEAGVAQVVGVDSAAIVSAANRLLFDSGAYVSMAHAVNPYGDGHAAQRIVEILAGQEFKDMRQPRSLPSRVTSSLRCAI